jgi:hypothetical protein
MIYIQNFAVSGAFMFTFLFSAGKDGKRISRLAFLLLPVLVVARNIILCYILCRIMIIQNHNNDSKLLLGKMWLYSLKWNFLSRKAKFLGLHRWKNDLLAFGMS